MEKESAVLCAKCVHMLQRTRMGDKPCPGCGERLTHEERAHCAACAVKLGTCIWCGKPTQETGGTPSGPSH